MGVKKEILKFLKTCSMDSEETLMKKIIIIAQLGKKFEFGSLLLYSNWNQYQIQNGSNPMRT